MPRRRRASRGGAARRSRFRPPTSSAGGLVAVAPASRYGGLARPRRGRQGGRAGLPPAGRAAARRRSASRRRRRGRCSRSSAWSRRRSARSCSRPRCAGRGPARAERGRRSTSASAPSGSSANRRRATRRSPACREPRLRVVGEPELAVDAAGVAWSRPEPAPPMPTTLADRVEQRPADGRSGVVDLDPAWRRSAFERRATVVRRLRLAFAALAVAAMVAFLVAFRAARGGRLAAARVVERRRRARCLGEHLVRYVRPHRGHARPAGPLERLVRPDPVLRHRLPGAAAEHACPGARAAAALLRGPDGDLARSAAGGAARARGPTRSGPARGSRPGSRLRST